MCLWFCCSGGLSNLLYHISLPDVVGEDEEKNQGAPKEVLLRVYGQIHGERALESLITESVIFTLLSERGLGPKLHGIFPGGRIEEFINARPLLTTELAEAKLSQQIAQKMAAIHTMEVGLACSRFQTKKTIPNSNIHDHLLLYRIGDFESKLLLVSASH